MAGDLTLEGAAQPRLFLDDERFPPSTGGPWSIVRSYAEAVAWVEANGFPAFVSFHR